MTRQSLPYFWRSPLSKCDDFGRVYSQLGKFFNQDLTYLLISQLQEKKKKLFMARKTDLYQVPGRDQYEIEQVQT